jgi:hypothetical protein
LLSTLHEVPKTRPPITRRRIKPHDVRVELDARERRYGVPSERLADAFRDAATGELVESEDYRSWSHAYELWLRASRR